MVNKFFKNYFGGLIYNIATIAIVYYIGRLIIGNAHEPLIIIAAWTISRLCIGKAKHYNDWKKCAVMTTSLFASMFLVSIIGVFPTIALVIFAVIILSGRGDIPHKHDNPYIDYKGESQDVNTK